MSRLEEIHNLPIYKKAELIFQLVKSLLASLPEDDEYIQKTKHYMLEVAMITDISIKDIESNSRKISTEKIQSL